VTLRLTASWQGVDALDLRIDRLIDVVESERITEALIPGAELIARKWKEKVPQPGSGHPHSTGRYHGSIRVERGDIDEFGIAALDILTDAVSPDGFPYPEALEFGTSTMAARPSAQPAFDEGVPNAIELAVAKLDALIVEAIAR